MSVIGEIRPDLQQLLQSAPAEAQQPSARPADPSSPAGPAFQVPYPPNPLFRGRDTELAKLADVLLSTEGGTAAVVPAIAGTGGIGKTQLAAEFAHRYRDRFPGGVFWLAMEQPDGIAGQVAACAGPDGVGLPGWQAMSFDERVSAVQRAWNEPVQRLLVFDNLEDLRLVEAWRPRGQQARVLITTRRGVWTAHLGVQPIRLPMLARAESLRLLLTPRAQAEGLAVEALLSDSATTTEADAICEQVGDLPLALTLAGAYLEAEPGVSLAEYRAELEREAIAHPSLDTPLLAKLPTHHAASVTATIALSYHQLDSTQELDARALQLLHMAALLAPAPLSSRLLARLLSDNPKELADARTTQAAVRRLALLGLIEPLPNQEAALHRLIAAYARGRLPEPTQGYEAVITRLTEELYAIVDAGYPLEGQPLLPHASGLATYALTKDTTTSSRFLDSLAQLLSSQGDLQGARPLYEHALAIDEQVCGPTHLDTAQGLNNLANLLKDQGDLQGAGPLFERALAIREQVLGPTHPDTAQGLNNLANLLKDQGDLQGAGPLFERALAIREQVLGPTHPATADSLNNLAILLSDQGDHGGARALYERALAIREQVLGPTHPDTAQSLNNLANLLSDQGDLEGAGPLYERALAIREQVLGPTHPDTADSLNNLAILLKDQGDRDGARALYERALAIREQVLGPEHPDTASSLNNLAILLAEEGDREGARRLHERALAIREQVLGPTHPDTASSLNNLAVLLAEEGDRDGARPLYERALAIREQMLGPEHPRTKATRRNLEHLLRLANE